MPQCFHILSVYWKRDIFTAFTLQKNVSLCLLHDLFYFIYFKTYLKSMKWPNLCKTLLFISPHKTVSCLPASSTSAPSGSCLMICPREDMQRRTSLILSALFFLMHSSSSSSSFFPLPCCYSRPLYLGHCTHPWGWETDGNFPPLLPSVFPSSSSPLCLFLCLQRSHYRFISAEHHSLVYKTCPVQCRWMFWGRRRTSDLPMRCWCPNS